MESIKIFLTMLITIFGLSLFSEETGNTGIVEAKTISDSLMCKERKHVIERYKVTKANDKIWIEDYPDSTCVYYFKNSQETGYILRCKRCKEWLSLPEMDKPSYKTIWYKDEKKEAERIENLRKKE